MLGIASNRARIRERQFAFEERDDAKLHRLSPRRHTSPTVAVQPHDPDHLRPFLLPGISRSASAPSSCPRALRRAGLPRGARGGRLGGLSRALAGGSSFLRVDTGAARPRGGAGEETAARRTRSPPRRRSGQQLLLWDLQRRGAAARDGGGCAGRSRHPTCRSLCRARRLSPSRSQPPSQCRRPSPRSRTPSWPPPPLLPLPLPPTPAPTHPARRPGRGPRCRR